MKLRLALLSTLCVVLAACGQHDAVPQTDKPDAAAETGKAQTPPKRGRLSPERIAQIKAIKATGKTGIWADATELCMAGNRVTLTWNVSGQAKNVVVMVVNRKGATRVFSGGGAIGQRQTGKWVLPGMSFKLLNAVGHAELGSVAFTEKKPCG